MINDILKWILKVTGNQCKEAKIAVVYEKHFVLICKGYKSICNFLCVFKIKTNSKP